MYFVQQNVQFVFQLVRKQLIDLFLLLEEMYTTKSIIIQITIFNATMHN